MFADRFKTLPIVYFEICSALALSHVYHHFDQMQFIVGKSFRGKNCFTLRTRLQISTFALKTDTDI